MGGTGASWERQSHVTPELGASGRKPVTPGTGFGNLGWALFVAYAEVTESLEVPTMADRTLRGSRMGAVSYETEYGAEPAPRNLAAYRCARGHEFTIPFSEEAEVPPTWECRLDG